MIQSELIFQAPPAGDKYVLNHVRRFQPCGITSDHNQPTSLPSTRLMTNRQ